MPPTAATTFPVTSLFSNVFGAEEMVRFVVDAFVDVRAVVDAFAIVVLAEKVLEPVKVLLVYVFAIVVEEFT